LSTLTKVLIVLVTVFSLFLCGIVVTYAADADNYKDKWQKAEQQRQAAIERRESVIRSETEQKQQFEADKAKLDKQIADLTALKTELEGQIDALKRDNVLKDQQASAATAESALATKLSSELRDQAAASANDVKELEANLTNIEKEMEETTRALMERVAALTDLESRNRQLIEEKQGLETQLSQVLQQYGRAPLRPPTVTTTQSIAQPIQRAVAQPPAPAAATRAINLNGRVTEVNMQGKIAAISIGAAAGVRANMKFHVTRGDRFICDILIFEVDAERAIGTLDLVQAEPQAGDMAATNL
jgi:hypothetical protein